MIKQLLLGLWAYDGWNNLNYVSGEMKHPHRDLPRVMFFGIPIVIICYLLANVAYLAVLRPGVVMHTNTVAMDFGNKLFGPVGGIILAVCVALSCFGVSRTSSGRKRSLVNALSYGDSLPMQVCLRERVSFTCHPSKVIFLASLANWVHPDKHLWWR